MRNRIVILIGILLLAVGIRAALLTRIAASDYYAAPWYAGEGGDAAEYSTIAKNIVEGSGFTLRGHATSIRPPLYVFFLAGAYALFGADNFTAVRILQIIVAAFSLALFWLLALRITRRASAAHMATLALGLYPRYMGYNLVLLSETLFFGLMLATLYWAVRWQETARTRYLTLAFGMLALCALTRPAALYFAPFLVLWVWLCSKKHEARSAKSETNLNNQNLNVPSVLNFRNLNFLGLFRISNFVLRRCSGQGFRISSLLPGLLLFAVLTGAWVARNYVQFDSFTFSSKSGGTVAESWDRTVLAPLGISDRDILAPYKSLSEEEFAKVGYRLFFTEIRDHPAFIAKVLVLKCIYWFSPGVKSSSASFQFVNALFMSLVFIGGALGMVLYWRTFGAQIPSLFLILFFAFSAMHILTVPYHRYRFPVFDPYMMLFAAYGVVELFDKMQNSKIKMQNDSAKF